MVLCILFALAASIGASYLLIDLAESSAQMQRANPPTDSTGGPLPDPGA